jgi:hypothetical protein
MRSLIAAFVAAGVLAAVPVSAPAKTCKPTRAYSCKCHKIKVGHRTYKACRRVRRHHRIPQGRPVPPVSLPRVPQLPPVVPPFPPVRVPKPPLP